MELQINKDKLYIMLKKSVKNLPPVSPEEMRDIEKTYGSPSKKRESFHSKKIDI